MTSGETSLSGVAKRVVRTVAEEFQTSHCEVRIEEAFGD